LDALLGTKTRILEIALAAGYESQEAFTRAFKSNFGLTPNEYRRLGDKSRFLRKVRVYGPGYHPTAADSVLHYAVPLAPA
jgi:AraC-like DNA-binding protein